MIFDDFHVCLSFFSFLLSFFHKKGDGDDGDGRIFLGDPTPINPRRDNISRKDSPSLRLYYWILCGPYENRGKMLQNGRRHFFRSVTKVIKLSPKVWKIKNSNFLLNVWSFYIFPNHSGYSHLIDIDMIPRIDLPMSQTVESQSKLF